MKPLPPQHLPRTSDDPDHVYRSLCGRPWSNVKGRHSMTRCQSCLRIEAGQRGTLPVLSVTAHGEQVIGHVIVAAGEGSTLRAIDKARRKFGPDANVFGIDAYLDGGRRYRYNVVIRSGQ